MNKTFALLTAAVSIAICSPAAYSTTTANSIDRNGAFQIAAIQDYMAIYRRALEKYDKQDLKGALADLDTVIRLKPDFAEAYANRGNVKDDSGNAEGALADYSKALTLDDKSHTTYFNRGITYSRLEKYPAAILDFEKSIVLNADYAPSYRGLGTAKYLNSEDKEVKRSGIADVRKSAALYEKQGEKAKAKEAIDLVKRMEDALR
jgi:tetratricopeptide (TPR) repeat protein